MCLHRPFDCQRRRFGYRLSNGLISCWEFEKFSWNNCLVFRGFSLILTTFAWLNSTSSLSVIIGSQRRNLHDVIGTSEMLYQTKIPIVHKTCYDFGHTLNQTRDPRCSSLIYMNSPPICSSVNLFELDAQSSDLALYGIDYYNQPNSMLRRP